MCNELDPASTDRRPHEFSRGQGDALALEPGVLIADEPVAAQVMGTPQGSHDLALLASIPGRDFGLRREAAPA